jgi:uncharacterized membrane protein
VLPTIKRHWKLATTLAFFSVAALTLQTLALQSEFVSYVIAIKRLDVILTVFFGCLLFREKDLRRRVAGSLVMVAGAILLSIT